MLTVTTLDILYTFHFRIYLVLSASLVPVAHGLTVRVSFPIQFHSPERLHFLN